MHTIIETDQTSSLQKEVHHLREMIEVLRAELENLRLESDRAVQQAVEIDGELVTERITQQEIADMVGASRAMVSRILKDLKAGGYITVNKKCITIHQKLPVRW